MMDANGFTLGQGLPGLFILAILITAYLIYKQSQR